jgi:GTPase SAR1 family protein
MIFKKANLLGNIKVGKSTFRNMLIEGVFNSEIHPTIGLDSTIFFRIRNEN